MDTISTGIPSFRLTLPHRDQIQRTVQLRLTEFCCIGIRHLDFEVDRERIQSVERGWDTEDTVLSSSLFPEPCVYIRGLWGTQDGRKLGTLCECGWFIWLTLTLT